VTKLAFEPWDDGRLTVNCDWAELFRAHGWTTFDAVWSNSERAAVAKRLRTDRVTLRFELTDALGEDRACYIKRHTASSWIEYVKPLLQGSRPCLGARIEWQALLDFHAAELPTMTPVMLGERGSDSFLITAALEGCTKLSEWIGGDDSAQQVTTRRAIASELGQLARQMHGAGLHHQDFYLGHLLRPQSGAEPIHVIDLGRVQHHGSWFARRWIVKDLAQLNYSARTVSRADRLRFLQAYLGREVAASDKPLVRSILQKTARIARHSRKHGL
jgi:heptose I phosphotransferase